MSKDIFFRYKAKEEMEVEDGIIPLFHSKDYIFGPNCVTAGLQLPLWNHYVLINSGADGSTSGPFRLPIGVRISISFEGETGYVELWRKAELPKSRKRLFGNMFSKK